MKFSSAILFLLICAILPGCGGSGANPKTVAQSFWDAIKAGDKEKAKTYATKASVVKLDKKKKKSVFDQEQGEVELSDEELKDGNSYIATKMSVKDEGKEISLSFKTVVVEEDGSWKVDLSLTMNEMKSGFYNGMMPAGGSLKVNANGKKVEYSTEEINKMTNDAMKKLGQQDFSKTKAEAEKQREEMKKKMEEMKKKLKKDKQ